MTDKERRKAAEWFESRAKNCPMPATRRMYEIAVKALEQEPKTGHWTHDGSHWKNRFICSECGYKLFEEQTNYCPNCGARMIVPQERSGKCSKCKYHINPNYTRCKECGAERSKND